MTPHHTDAALTPALAGLMLAIYLTVSLAAAAALLLRRDV